MSAVLVPIDEVAHPNCSAVHHRLVLRLDRAGVMEDHDDTFELPYSCITVSNILLSTEFGAPFGGVSVRPMRTIPFRTCALRILFNAKLPARSASVVLV